MVERVQRLRHALACGAVAHLGQRGQQAQAHGGQGGAQLVGGVGGQGAFGVQRAFQALQQVVGAADDGLQLGGQGLRRRQRGQVPAIALLQFAGNLSGGREHPLCDGANQPAQ